MKRSEMVNKIMSYLTYNKKDDPKEIADGLLTKIEELGMLPPRIIYTDKYNSQFDKNEWELEQELDDSDNYCGAV
jgi:hypothetical protein